MKRVLFLMLLITLGCTTGLLAQNGFRKAEQSGIVFEWKIEGDDITIRLSAPTEGWVAVGFNPSRMMKDADFKMAYVDGNSVVLQDHYGTGNISHKKDIDVDGTDNFELISGKEEDGWTTVEFKMPLDSGDSRDTPLVEGEETHVLLAYATRDNFSRKHRRRTSINIEL